MELQDIRSKDWSISLDGAGEIVQGLEDIKQCVRIILATQKGSDPLRPNFGVDVLSYLDLPDNRVATELTREIIEQIGLWEKRVIIEKITYKLSPGRVSFAVEWKLTANSQTVITNIDYGDPANGALNNVVPPPTQKVEAPTFSPASGSYAGFVAVVIETATPRAIIRYTTDGSVPNDLSTLYTGPVIRALDTVVRARAYADAFLPSNVSTIAYDVVQYATEILTAPGTYLGEVLVEVISNSEGIEIRYTLDGSEPTILSPLYVDGILLSTSATVKTRAFNPPGGSASAAVATFTIKSLAPSISPTEGVFETSRLITMMNPNPIGSIYYTLDGSEPTEGSMLYEGPFTLTQNADIRARVISPLNISSDIAEAVIFIKVASPSVSPEGAVFFVSQEVEITTNEPGGVTHYRLDGGTPTESDPVLTPFTITNDAQVRARTFRSGALPSDVIGEDYTLFVDPDVEAFMIATGITDAAIEGHLIGFVTDLKDAGLWAKLQAIYPMVGGAANTCKFNLKDPRDIDAAFRLSFLGGWTFSSAGAKGNLTNARADTFNTGSIFNTGAGISFGYLSNEPITGAENRITMGRTDAFIQSVEGVSSIRYRINALPRDIAVDNSAGYFAMSVTRGGSIRNVLNKAGAVTTETIASQTSLSAVNFALGAFGVTTTNPSNQTIQFAFIADYLSAAEMTALRTAVLKFNADLGR